MDDDLLKAIFLKKTKIANQTWQFDFKKNFSFESGQYTTLFLKNDNRDFTISSSPQDKKIFSIVTKEGISDFKKNLFIVKPGWEISFKKPAGGFTLRKNTNQKVFLAGGIGMTPFYSMILANKTIKTPITLIVSFAKIEDFIFYSQLKQIEESNKNIHIVYTTTQEKWNGDSGRISKELIERYVVDIYSPEYMIAGGEEMVEDTEQMLLGTGINADNIRIDIFTGY